MIILAAQATAFVGLAARSATALGAHARRIGGVFGAPGGRGWSAISTRRSACASWAVAARHAAPAANLASSSARRHAARLRRKSAPRALETL